MSQAFPPLGREYEPFLYAVVCNEGNGMPLTMVSAIARTGADPWSEAARIAKLPKTKALEALARIIPDRNGAENSAIANRLFALLPVARGNIMMPVAGVKKDTLQRPLVLIVGMLLLGLALVAVATHRPHSDAARGQPPSPAPTAEKADP